jgi:hypothetical protein
VLAALAATLVSTEAVSLARFTAGTLRYAPPPIAAATNNAVSARM